MIELECSLRRYGIFWDINVNFSLNAFEEFSPIEIAEFMKKAHALNGTRG